MGNALEATTAPLDTQQSVHLKRPKTLPEKAQEKERRAKTHKKSLTPKRPQVKARAPQASRTPTRACSTKREDANEATSATTTTSHFAEIILIANGEKHVILHTMTSQRPSNNQTRNPEMWRLMMVHQQVSLWDYLYTTILWLSWRGATPTQTKVQLFQPEQRVTFAKRRNLQSAIGPKPKG